MNRLIWKLTEDDVVKYEWNEWEGGIRDFIAGLSHYGLSHKRQQYEDSLRAGEEVTVEFQSRMFKLRVMTLCVKPWYPEFKAEYMLERR